MSNIANLCMRVCHSCAICMPLPAKNENNARILLQKTACTLAGYIRTSETRVSIRDLNSLEYIDWATGVP